MTWRERETAVMINSEVRWDSKRNGGRVADLGPGLVTGRLFARFAGRFVQVQTRKRARAIRWACCRGPNARTGGPWRCKAGDARTPSSSSSRTIAAG